MAALFGDSMVNRSTVLNQPSRVFDELTFPRTMATVRENRSGARSEKREPGTRSVRDPKRRPEVYGSVWDREKVKRRRAVLLTRFLSYVNGGRVGREKERRGVGFVPEDREREVVNGDERVRGRTLDLEKRVTTTW
ncbi:LOW QUALITY PROTEIN: hypothetical protein TorRG33x02_041770 [Trema orientale]|uniref:Uncharacterized protein n=1 Tax=Trema orientale TaxID=63057 RepID=A0A2P5FQG7_TREOI|nr:LOW QUALITY PROTEIN: hypothetical protein TorRG33x02_041770 [Trema orientale]